MAEQKLSREEQLVALFVNACSGAIGRTRLMKLLYMADYEARRFLGRPLSSIPYVWYDHGPFDSELYQWIKRLEDDGLISSETVLYPSGIGYLYSSKGTPPGHDLNPDEVEILAYVCREYSQVALRELLDDIVYQTEPMLAAKAADAKGQPLDMDAVNLSQSKQFTVPYAELLARSRQVRAGHVVRHADAMARLLGQPRHAAA